jgi:hypothetical protein
MTAHLLHAALSLVASSPASLAGGAANPAGGTPQPAAIGATAASAPSSAQKLGQGKCVLLGGEFATFVQCVVGMVALSVLVVKRACEHPQRPFTVWLYDSGKNAVGSAVAHFANLGVAILLGIGASGADECGLYFVNFLLDVLLGVPALFLLLRWLEHVAVAFDSPMLKESGNYGEPPRFEVWLVQTSAFTCLVLLAKIAVAALVYACQGAAIAASNWLFTPFRGHPQEELVVVMVICPCFLNMLQFWYVDEFLKSKDPGYEDIDGMTMGGAAGGVCGGAGAGAALHGSAAAAFEATGTRRRAQLLPGQTRFGWSKQEQDGGQTASL